MTIYCYVKDCKYNVGTNCLIDDEVVIEMDCTKWQWTGFCESYSPRDEEEKR